MILKRLIKLANQLDAKGQYTLADKMEKSANALSIAGEGIQKLAPPVMSFIDRVVANLKRYYPNMTQSQLLKAKNIIKYFPNMTDKQILDELKLMNPGRLNAATQTPFKLQPDLLQGFYQQPYRLPISNRYLWQNTPASVKALGVGGLGAAALMWPRGPQSTGYNNPTSPQAYNQYDQTPIAGYDLTTGRTWKKGDPAPPPRYHV